MKVYCVQVLFCCYERFCAEIILLLIVWYQHSLCVYFPFVTNVFTVWIIVEIY